MRTQKLRGIGAIQPNRSLRAQRRAIQKWRREFTGELMESRLLLAGAVDQPAAVAGDVRTGPAAKVGWALSDLYADYQVAKAAQTSDAAFEASQSLLPVSDGMVVVDAVADGDPARLEADLSALRMQNVARAGRMVSGLLPIDSIDDMALLSSLRFAQPAWNSYNVGLTTSQGDASKKTDQARSTFSGVPGITGTGMTVGVLSDSFDTGPGSYATDVGSSDLPAGVTVIQDSAGGTDEGRAMLQLVYDTAPGSTLAFATANGGQANMASNITKLRTMASADVIVDDVIYYAEPMFQDGVIAQSVDTNVAAGVPYYSSAGNNARKSYESVWRNGVNRAFGSIPSAAGASTFFGGTTFDFDPGAGVDDMQSFTLANNSTALIVFQWDQPFFSVSGGAGTLNELDAYILNSAGSQVVSAGGVNLSQGGDAVEVLSVSNTSGGTVTYNLMFAYDTTSGGPAPTFVKTVDFGSSNPTQFVTNSSTAYGHTNAANADSIAAAPWFSTPVFGVNPPVVESFSSAGGVAIRFNTAGVPIAPVTRQTPDFTGPDGGNTSFFGSDIVTDADTFPNFFGTSAAAPEVAALAALIRGVNFALTPAQIRTVLQNSCVDMDDPLTGGFDVGVDFRTGFGLVDGYKALAQVIPIGIWTGLGDATSFHQNTNWSQNTLPTSSIDATIKMPSSNPTIVVNQAESVKSLVSTETVNVTAPGTLTLAQNSTFTGGLTIAGQVIVTANGTRSIVANTLSITGKLNLNDNDLIVTGMSYSAVESLVKAGFGNFNWLGTGITSSTAATFAQTDGSRALGVINNLDWGYGTFSGRTVSSTDILVKFTYVADSNLDGLVDNDDFGQFLYGFNGGGSARWLNGDFDYSGFVDNDDFGWFLVGLSAFNASGGTQL